MPSASLPPVAFIGIGIMGRHLAAHLQRAGYPLHVFNRTREKTAELVAAGATWHPDPGSAAAAASVVFTMLGGPPDVASAYLAPEGIVARAAPGTLLIDLTTSSPQLAREIAAAATARGLASLDAPVSGGDVGAREARLVIMAGGDESAFARAQPLLALLGRTIVRIGPAGSGQYCKLANQIAVAVGMVAWCEALAFARRAQLDPALVRETLAGGAAGSWAMTHLAPRALAADFSPGFSVKHLRKDIAIASGSADELGCALPGLEEARQLFAAVAERGWDESGTQVLYRHYVEND